MSPYVYDAWSHDSLVFTVGECQCAASFSGADCSTNKNKPPLLEKEAFEGACDSSKKSCRKFIIPGYDFVRNSLSCKFVPFTVSI